MRIGLQTLISPTHDPELIARTLNPFVAALTQALQPNEVVTISHQERHTVDIPIIFVQSGGVEGLFKNIYHEMQGPFIFLATDKHNGLAASMELLSFLQQNQQQGEILHGSIASITQRITDLARVFSTQKQLQGLRVGVIGQPSDWLIASHINPTQIREQLGVEIIDSKAGTSPSHPARSPSSLHSDKAKQPVFCKGSSKSKQRSVKACKS